MNIYIDGFGIAGYRSFGEETQFLGPFKKINFFVGQNNSGKSNILSFIKGQFSVYVEAARQDSAIKLSALDRHQSNGRSLNSTSFALCIPKHSKQYRETLAIYNKQKDRIQVVLSSEILQRDDASWLQFHAPNENSPLIVADGTVDAVRDANILQPSEWAALWSYITNQNAGDLTQHWIPETLRKLFFRGLAVPKINVIQAIRQIGNAGSTPSDDDFSGTGIIDRLAAIQNPDYNERHKKAQFDAINKFVQKVLGVPTARLEIPNQRNRINVEMDDKMLPLESLGTGIHEVIILAAAATVLTEQVICIEEPELHLHPILQKKLIRYLQVNTSNQYFFTTHSAHLLDTPEAAVFHVRLHDGATVVERAESAAEKTVICADLGYRASDLLQSNCVIWVEGPSDRIYINHWIKAVDDRLIEGIHYSIMFYGGRLLSHISADDSEITEFISLRRLNRYIAIVIDSDRRSLGTGINSTKTRVKNEFDDGRGFAWITHGREIENYVSEEILSAAVKEVHPKSKGLASYGRFDRVLEYRVSRGKIENENIDKVKIAHAVANRPANLDVFDLRKNIEKTVMFIREANDVEIMFLD